MGRDKVNDKLTDSLKSRNNSFFKRTKGLKKKAFELATLCGVDVCMICFEPQSNQQCKPMTWPEDSQEFSRIIKRYQSTSKEEKDRRKLDLLGFLKERNKKLEDESNKKGEERANMMYPSLDTQLNNMPEDMLRSLLVKLDAKMETVNRKIEMLKCKESLQRREISVDIATQTDQLQEMLDIHGKNQLMDSNNMPLQPIQPYPVSVMKTLDLSHMSDEDSYNQIIPTYANNTNLLLSPTEECYGSQEFGMLDSGCMFHSQVQSWNPVCCCERFMQLQPSVMGWAPCLSSIPPYSNLPYVSTLFPHQTHQATHYFSDIQ